jgi:hypothetical protein
MSYIQNEDLNNNNTYEECTSSGKLRRVAPVGTGVSEENFASSSG